MSDRLTRQQQQLINMVRKTTNLRASQVVEEAKKAGVDHSQIQKIVHTLEKCPIVKHISIGPKKTFQKHLMISHLTDTGYIMNEFEWGRPQPGREIWEYTLYGATPDVHWCFAHMDLSERPLYGSINFTGNPSGMSNLRTYGFSWFEFKTHIREDCTFTPMDSSQVYRKQVVTWEGIEGVLASNPFGRYWYEYVLDKTEPTRIPNSLSGYMEVQIMGRLMLDRDVKALHYPIRFHNDDKFQQELEQFATHFDIELISF